MALVPYDPKDNSTEPIDLGRGMESQHPLTPTVVPTPPPVTQPTVVPIHGTYGSPDRLSTPLNDTERAELENLKKYREMYHEAAKDIESITKERDQYKMKADTLDAMRERAGPKLDEMFATATSLQKDFEKFTSTTDDTLEKLRLELMQRIAENGAYRTIILDLFGAAMRVVPVKEE